MALIFELAAQQASGTDALIFSQDCGGAGPLRLTVKNSGFQAFTSAKVQHRSKPAGLADVIDSTTFATLAAAASKSVVIPAPVEVLEFLVSAGAGSGSLVDAALNDGLST